MNIASTSRALGFVLAYFLCTSVLFFVLRFFDRIPGGWTMVDMGLIVALLSAVGYALKRYLS